MDPPRATTPTAPLVVVLAVAVLAISSSAVLVRWAAVSAVTLACWRTAGGALVLAPAAVRAPTRPDRRQWWLMVASGAALGIHFSAWLASLLLTSVAASVTLVSTAPLLIAAWRRLTGHRLPRSSWLALTLAAAGIVTITAVDVATAVDAADALHHPTGERPLVGNALALLGAAAMAAYLLIGDHVRRHLSTAAYASRTYGAAAALLVVAALASGTTLVPTDTRTWLVVAAMTAGPQLAGHTSLNYLLPRLGSLTVSLALLLEPIGASVLVLVLFGEWPSLGAWLGAPAVLAAVAVQVTITARAGSPPATGGPARH